ncbi:MAG: response regulator [Pseudomonadota bacterium]
MSKKVQETLENTSAQGDYYVSPVDSRQDNELAELANLSDLSEKAILVVDDSTFNREMLKRYLDRAQISVAEASNSQEALSLLANFHFDLVLMDMQMPGMNGLDTTQLIRQTPSPYQQVQIVMLTANFDEASIAAAHRAGANGFMSKPVNLDPCYREIRRWLTTDLASKLNASVRRSIPQAATQNSAQTAPLIDADDIAEDIRQIAAPLLDSTALFRLRERAIVEKTIDIFHSESKDYILLLEQSLQSNNLAQADRTLHAYLTSCSEIGAQALYQMLRYAYQATQQGRWPKIEDWLKRIKILQQKTLEALTWQLTTDNSPTQAKLDSTSVGAEENRFLPHAKQAFAREKQQNTWQDSPLLNTTRLAELKMIGMLDELPDDLARMASLIQSLRNSIENNDVETMAQSVHSLLGLSSTIGCTALHQYLYYIYPPISEGTWPHQENWLETIVLLVDQSAHALRDGGYCA